MLTKVYLLSVLLVASVQCQGGFGGGNMPQMVNAAVISNQRVSFRDVPSRSNAQPANVFIDSAVSPINLVFRSSSSPLNIEQRHTPGEGSFRQTSSEDAPHRLMHTVTKPIIQMVREIIQPRRIVQQQIMPVQEEIKTIISRSKRDPDSSIDADFPVRSPFAGPGDDDEGVGTGDGDFGNVDMGNDFGSFGGGGLGASRGASRGGANAGRSQGARNRGGAGRFGSQGGSSLQAPSAQLAGNDLGSGDGDFGNVDSGNDFGSFGGGGGGSSASRSGNGNRSQGGGNRGGAFRSRS